MFKLNWEKIMKYILIVAGLSIMTFGGCQYLNHKAGLEDDWIGEELLEDVIENKTGMKIDLTPNTHE